MTLCRAPARWPGLAVLLVNQQHSGDPLKIRRELRKF